MTNAESHVPIGLLRELIDADFDTGCLTWKSRESKHFSEPRKRSAIELCLIWNSNFSGKSALNHKAPSGHLSGKIFSRQIFSHRVVFALYTGDWPTQSIDHINGNPGDNRIANLRDVSHQENCKNQRIRKTNTSGFMGVTFNRKLGKWAAQFSVNGKHKYAGFFESKDEAIEARSMVNSQLNFHQNHGRAL